MFFFFFFFFLFIYLFIYFIFFGVCSWVSTEVHVKFYKRLCRANGLIFHQNPFDIDPILVKNPQKHEKMIQFHNSCEKLVTSAILGQKKYQYISRFGGIKILVWVWVVDLGPHISSENNSSAHRIGRVGSTSCEYSKYTCTLGAGAGRGQLWPHNLRLVTA